MVAAPEYNADECGVNNNKFCTANTESVEGVFDVEKCDTVADCYENKQKEQEEDSSLPACLDE